jgi:DNA-binding NtrC family response regulator
MELPERGNVAEMPARSTAGGDHTPTFLVIDDDPVQRMTMGKVGTKAGYKVTTAASIEDARKEISTHKFDAITLDLLLGGQNGILMLGEVAKLNPDALLIVVSGASSAVRESTLQIAMNLKLNSAELPKPVDLAALRTLLTNNLKAVNV